MPDIPPLSGEKIIKILERHGFVRKRQRGSHVMMRRDSNGCVVPLHREVKVGTLAGILRQAGIDPHTFAEWVKSGR